MKFNIKNYGETRERGEHKSTLSVLCDTHQNWSDFISVELMNTTRNSFTFQKYQTFRHFVLSLNFMSSNFFLEIYESLFIESQNRLFLNWLREINNAKAKTVWKFFQAYSQFHQIFCLLIVTLNQNIISQFYHT